MKIRLRAKFPRTLWIPFIFLSFSVLSFFSFLPTIRYFVVYNVFRQLLPILKWQLSVELAMQIRQRKQKPVIRNRETFVIALISVAYLKARDINFNKARPTDYSVFDNYSVILRGKCSAERWRIAKLLLVDNSNEKPTTIKRTLDDISSPVRRQWTISEYDTSKRCRIKLLLPFIYRINRNFN